MIQKEKVITMRDGMEKRTNSTWIIIIIIIIILIIIRLIRGD